MHDFPLLPGTSTGAVAPSSGTRPARPEEAGSSPAFEALLQRLTERAAELDAKSRELARPEDLPGAVDAARASLEDALTLGERLLEAYRAARNGEAGR